MWLLSGVRFITSTFLSCNRPLQDWSPVYHYSSVRDVWRLAEDQTALYCFPVCAKAGISEWEASGTGIKPQRCQCSSSSRGWRSPSDSALVHISNQAMCTKDHQLVVLSTQQVLLHVKPHSWREGLRRPLPLPVLGNIFISVFQLAEVYNSVTLHKQKSFIQRATWFLALMELW
jgi:hypothetical protein